MFEQLLNLIKYGNEEKALEFVANATIEDLKVTDKGGFTILHYLCQSKLLKASKAVIEKFPSLLLAQDRFNQQTPLFHAIKKGNIELVEYVVINFPETINIRDDRGQTIILKVLENKYIEINNLSIEEGERRRAKIFDGNAHHWDREETKKAIEEKYNNLLKIILQKLPALANAQDKLGSVPAHLAALYGDNEIIIELHKTNANCLSILNYYSRSSIDCANSRGNLGTAQLIEEIIDTMPKEAADYEAILGQIHDLYEHT